MSIKFNTKSGVITAASVTSGGSGYPNGQYYVFVSGGSGGGAILQVTAAAGIITSVDSILYGGSNYESGDTVTVEHGSGTGSVLGLTLGAESRVLFNSASHMKTGDCDCCEEVCEACRLPYIFNVEYTDGVDTWRSWFVLDNQEGSPGSSIFDSDCRQEGLVTAVSQVDGGDDYNSGSASAATIGGDGIGLKVGVTAAAAGGGGDITGYTVTETGDVGAPTYTWNDISGTGTALGMGDDDNQQVPIGFSFPWYDTSYTTIRVISNGLASFTNTTSPYLNGFPLPNSGAPENLLAPLWRDLDPTSGGEVYYEQTDSSTFIIQWDHVPYFGVSETVTMQIVLKSDGKIYFYYNTDFTNNGFGNCGYQNADFTDGDSIHYYDSDITAEYAILLDPIFSGSGGALEDLLLVEPGRGYSSDNKGLTVDLSPGSGYLFEVDTVATGENNSSGLFTHESKEWPLREWDGSSYEDWDCDITVEFDMIGISGDMLFYRARVNKSSVQYVGQVANANLTWKDQNGCAAWVNQQNNFGGQSGWSVTVSAYTLSPEYAANVEEPYELGGNHRYSEISRDALCGQNGSWSYVRDQMRGLFQDVTAFPQFEELENWYERFVQYDHGRVSYVDLIPNRAPYDAP